MKFELITLFPEFFTTPLATGLLGKAQANGSVRVDYIDPRAYTHDRHHTVDDTPYGGGPGMVMKVEPLAAAIGEARRRGPGPVVLLSPQGRPLRQTDLGRYAALGHLILISGRYEGFDERIAELADEQISLGDFVLTGGEYVALAIVDGVARLVPGTIGNAASAESDSFASGMLEHPHYTRPLEFAGRGVPEVLRGGDHAAIARFRRDESLRRTFERRPDLLAALPLAEADLDALEALVPERNLELAVAPGAELARVLHLAAAYRVPLNLIGVPPEALAQIEYAPAPPLRGGRSNKAFARVKSRFARARDTFAAQRRETRCYPDAAALLSDAEARRPGLRHFALVQDPSGARVARIPLDAPGLLWHAPDAPADALPVAPRRVSGGLEPGAALAVVLDRAFGEG